MSHSFRVHNHDCLSDVDFEIAVIELQRRTNFYEFGDVEFTL
jgi:hypothetical protein